MSILTQLLSNSSQHIMVDGCWSKLDNIVSGVLQGSVLANYYIIVSSVHLEAFLKCEKYIYDYILVAVVPSPGIGVTVQNP